MIKEEKQNKEKNEMTKTEQTARLYLVTCDNGYMMDEQGSHYSLTPWGNDTRYYQGHDDGGVLYNLPAGYHVGIGKDEQEHIYNSADCPAEIVTHSSGLPQLVIDLENMPVLTVKTKTRTKITEKNGYVTVNEWNEINEQMEETIYFASSGGGYVKIFADNYPQVCEGLAGGGDTLTLHDGESLIELIRREYRRGKRCETVERLQRGF